MIVLPPGKTAWSTATSTWSGRRNLTNANNDSSIDGKNVSQSNVSQSHVSLQSTLPKWCSFVGTKNISAGAVLIL